MSTRLPPETTAQSQRCVERFFDTVAKLLAKRWLREQQSRSNIDQQGQKGSGDSPGSKG